MNRLVLALPARETPVQVTNYVTAHGWARLVWRYAGLFERASHDIGEQFRTELCGLHMSFVSTLLVAAMFVHLAADLA